MVVGLLTVLENELFRDLIIGPFFGHFFWCAVFGTFTFGSFIFASDEPLTEDETQHQSQANGCSKVDPDGSERIERGKSSVRIFH